MQLKNAALLGVAAWALAGCATVINGTNQEYQVNSTPEGATVSFTSGDTCVTPCEIELRRKDDQRVDISLDGYRSEYVLVQSRLGGSTFGNAILGGGIGAVVDGTNGASNRLYPRPLNIQLVEEGSDEEAVLLDEEGEVRSTVDAHNGEVRDDVAKTIGVDLAGLSAGEEAAD
ncbi:PEGA domain-containing protein [Alteraurantiacibacter aquimixticola]|nr:PEGA domain-containing protein [Alteraurantiacibacter aquimixticola]